jgi:hypothetical protein
VRIAERAPQRLDRGVHAVLEIHKRVHGPQTALQFLSREQFARLFEQQRENLKGPASETDFSAMFTQLTRAEVNVVGVEAEPTFGREFVAHQPSWGEEVYFERDGNSSLRAPLAITRVVSVHYGFTPVVRTNDLRCIERFDVSYETARALRNEMKTLKLKIESKKETKMKMTAVVKTSLYVAALGLACMLPVTARAQSDVMPDSFAFSADEAPAARPALVAAVDDVNQTQDDFQGKVTLPYNAKCAGKNLKAGQYLVSVKLEATGRVVTIHGDGADMNIRVREVPTNRRASQSALLVRNSGHGRTLAAVSVEGLNAMFYLGTSASQALTERLPIS